MRLVSVFAALVVAGLTTTAASAENQDGARPFDAASLQQVLDANKAHPVIVHFWGLTCGNCMAELKDWGEFARTHPEATLVLVNWDRRGAQPRGWPPRFTKRASTPFRALRWAMASKKI